MATKRPKPAEAKKPEDSELMTTTISISRQDWDLLRRVSFTRAMATGGRASVSAVIASVIEAQREKLQKEVGR